jgi:hypothetical protein
LTITGTSAITIGDALFRVDGDAWLSKKASGYFFGIANGKTSTPA